MGRGRGGHWGPPGAGWGHPGHHGPPPWMAGMFGMGEQPRAPVRGYAGATYAPRSWTCCTPP